MSVEVATPKCTQTMHSTISSEEWHHSLPNHMLSQKYTVLNVQEQRPTRSPAKRDGQKKRSKLW